MKLQIPGYRLERQIGKGGMALVYQAVQENFDRKVAVKILSPAMAVEKEYAERFMLEARTVATLNHPHIIPVYDVGQIGSHYYIVMEYLPGNTLKQWITAGLEVEEALEICAQVGDALHYASKKGIVHRDIKPENIMFREDNSAVLTDFGIARSSKAASELTQEGCMIGTPSYMSPEQARGKAVDGRSDIYSLGVVLFEMLAREKPFSGDDPMAIALAHLSDPVPQLPQHLAYLQPLLNKMLAKQADQRFDSGLALCKAIKSLLRDADTKVVAAPQVDKAQERAVVSERQGVSSLEALADGGEIFADEGCDVSGDFQLPSKNLSCEIERYKKALLFSRSRLKVTVVSDDPTQFNVQFSQVSQQILDWYHQYGKQAKQLELQFYCKPWVLESIQRAVEQLTRTVDPFGFLATVDVSYRVCDLDGREIYKNAR